MNLLQWQLETPLDSIVFDCDGTLSTLEGIDSLAEAQGTGDQVKKITAEAMGKTGLNPDVYKQRLDLVYPTENNIQQLGQHYIDHCVPDILDVVKLLTKLDKKIYIISAGLFPAVAMLGDYLNIPRENIYAVNIRFDSAGNFSDYDHYSPLIQGDGKRAIISELKKMHKSMAFVGDGLNDIVAKDLVTRFIGYGGIFYRKNIADLCEYYIGTASMSALLPLVLTAKEFLCLDAKEKMLYEKGSEAILSGDVLISG